MEDNFDSPAPFLNDNEVGLINAILDKISKEELINE